MLLESMEPDEAYALYILNNLNSHKIVELANTWILTGLFTESLNDLCWEKDPEMYIVGPMFEKLMEELNIPPLTRLEAANLIIEKTLTQITNREIEPEVGGSYIYNYVWGEVEDEYPVIKYLGDSLGLEHIFCWLREIWDCRDGSRILYHTDLPRDQAENKFEEHLIEEAQNWLAK
jgi:hypothetical protein